MSASDPFISIKNLNKRYGRIPAIDQMNLDIFSNELIGIVGNNGSGKTTFLKLLLDLLLPDSGSVFFRGKNVHRSDHWKHKTGAYIDESFLIDYLTPGEYIRLLGQMRGLSLAAIEECLDRMRQFVTFNIIRESKLIRSLSDGNKHKLGILGAVLFKTELIILDEPFNFLDPASQHDLVRILRESVVKQKATIIISSHNLQFVSQICSRVILFESGRIMDDFQNSPESLSRLKTYFNIES